MGSIEGWPYGLIKHVEVVMFNESVYHMIFFYYAF